MGKAKKNEEIAVDSTKFHALVPEAHGSNLCKVCGLTLFEGPHSEESGEVKVPEEEAASKLEKKRALVGAVLKDATIEEHLETDTEEAAPPQRITRTEVRLLHVPSNEHIKAELADEVAREIRQATTAEDDLKAISAEYRERIGRHWKRAGELATEIREGGEARIPVEIEYDYGQGVIIEVRQDTHEEILRREMTPEEAQRPLPFLETEKPAEAPAETAPEDAEKEEPRPPAQHDYQGPGADECLAEGCGRPLREHWGSADASQGAGAEA